MKKKYYFNSIWNSLIYFLIVLFLLGLLILCLLADEKSSGVALIIFCLSICIVLLLFWVGFSLSMRIQIDYDNEKLYIRHPCFLKMLNFQDILSIEVIDYNELAFDFIITTKDATKKLSYSRYYKKKPTLSIQTKITELKNDLMNISRKNY